MKTLWHLVKHDLLRFRWSIALLAVAFVVVPLVSNLVLEDELASFSRKPELGLSVALALVGGIVWLMVVAGVVQGDTPHGTAAGWMTRPIGATRMAIAKIVVLLLVSIGLPLLTQFGVFAGLGCPVGVALNSALGVAGLLALVLAPISLIAAATRRLPSFLGVLFTAFVLFVAAATIAAVGLTSGSMVGGGRLATGTVVASSGSLVVFTLAYHWRSKLKTWLGIVVVVGAAVLCASLWPWSFDEPTFGARLVAAPPEAKLRAEPGTFSQGRTMSKLIGGAQFELGSKLTLEGMPAGKLWRLARVKGLASFANAEPGALMLSGTPLWIGLNDALRDAAGGPVQHRGGPFTEKLTTSMRGTVRLAESMSAVRTGKFSGQARVEQVELRRLGELRVEAGAGVTVGAVSLRITSVDARPDGFRVKIRRESFRRSFGEPPPEEVGLRRTWLLFRQKPDGVAIATREETNRAMQSAFGHQIETWSVDLPYPEGVAGDPGARSAWSILVIGEVPMTWAEIPVEFALEAKPNGENPLR